jgi:Bacterial aa3 type cytochrome c oxidase subunit IV
MAAEGDFKKEVLTHQRGYAAFTRLMKWATIVSLAVALIVILLISN